jgi:hypothetical protein
LVGNTVDVGGPTNKSGCLPTSAAYHKVYDLLPGVFLLFTTARLKFTKQRRQKNAAKNMRIREKDEVKKLLKSTTKRQKRRYRTPDIKRK